MRSLSSYYTVHSTVHAQPLLCVLIQAERSTDLPVILYEGVLSI
jgi:hypothetical protein